ncbi:hypothetical protein ACSHWB_45180 [Lentzea sp. HUAS TT2]|uniref:hypothetical protein n=1 Tax=Lentzea sp. HUAS TT2 TaxID=3447454 RepID=UPI003F6FE697
MAAWLGGVLSVLRQNLRFATVTVAGSVVGALLGGLLGDVPDLILIPGLAAMLLLSAVKIALHKRMRVS